MSSEKARHLFFVACYLFLKKDNKILLLKRYNTGYQDGNYTMVSGHILRNMEPNKADDLRWFDIGNLPTNIIGYIPKVIKHIEKGQIYSEYSE